MRALAAVVLASGCSFTPGVANSTGATDTGSGSAIDGAPGCATFSTQFDTCVLPAPAGDLTLAGNNTYDTSMHKLTAGTTEVPVTHVQVFGLEGAIEAVVVRDFHMMPDAKLRAVGASPLAIVATGSITIDGTTLIDLSNGGAGARGLCPGGPVAGANQGGGAGGGGGGGFSAAGGNGGNGDSDGTTQSAGGAGGGANPTAPKGPLGGCKGANGGNGDNSGGGGGAGGGALYLVAAMRIDHAAGASINAGGGGGGGGTVGGLFSNGDAGGGGGGAGGMIFLEAPVVRSAGILAANGGGGGEASGGGNSGNRGTTGQLSTMPAPGGAGNADTGSDGGAGGAQGTLPGVSVTNVQAGGGGGGGGAAGYIFVRAPDQQLATVSPDPT